MRYILADKKKAIRAGFIEAAHRCNDRIMILNENEVKFSSRMDGNLAERVTALKGMMLSQAQTYMKIKRKGKYQITIKQ